MQQLDMAESTLLVDTPTVARLLGMSPGTLANWRSQGVGPKFYKCGGRVRYVIAEVAQWLRQEAAASGRISDRTTSTPTNSTQHGGSIPKPIGGRTVLDKARHLSVVPSVERGEVFA